MLKKIKVEIITGFLGSGKTSFIKSYLDISRKNTLNKSIIVQCEKGKEHLNNKYYKDRVLSIKEIEIKDISEDFFIKNINFYEPNKIIIENNGIYNTWNLINILLNKRLKKYLTIVAIVVLVDAKSFEMFTKNLGHMIIPNINMADVVVINNKSYIKKEQLIKIEKQIKKMNSNAQIIKSESSLYIQQALNKFRLIK